MNILTDEEAKKIFQNEHCNISADFAGILCRAIEAAALEKLAEQIDMKPAAYLKTWSSVDNAVADKKRVDLTEDSGPWLATNAFPKTEPLYTETQLLAAQQIAARACAEYLIKGNHDDEFIASRGIIAGEWRKYL